MCYYPSRSTRRPSPAHRHGTQALVTTKAPRLLKSLISSITRPRKYVLWNFAEGTCQAAADQPWTVSLPGDDPAAFKILANIAHASLQAVPRAPSIDQLFNLVTLTHYYDATKLLAPWSRIWRLEIQEPMSNEPLQMYKFLHISLELGWKKAFEITVRRILMESPASIEKDAEGCENLPWEVIDRINEIRLQAISDMLALFRDLMELLTVVDEKPRWCKYASYMGPHRCESMILGSMVFCLTRAKLFPFCEPEDVEEGVMPLYRKLVGLVIHNIGQPEKKGEDHADCNPKNFLLERLQHILAGMADPVDQLCRQRVEKQAVMMQF